MLKPHQQRTFFKSSKEALRYYLNYLYEIYFLECLINDDLNVKREFQSNY